ncbi:MAG: hypothetical protein ACTSV2_05540 [Candidatus Thorarchaeota archaeon]
MKTIHNKASLMLCVLGGSLMIASGASGSLGYMPSLDVPLEIVFGSAFTLTFETLIGILAFLTGLGGMGVIIGGLIVTTQRVEVGRIIIMTSMAIGTISLIMSLFQLALSRTFAMSMITQITQSIGWVGAILAIEARIISKQHPIV